MSKIYLSKDTEETPVNQIIRETVVMVKEKKEQDDLKKLEEFGLIETKGKTRIRFHKYTQGALRKPCQSV